MLQLAWFVSSTKAVVVSPTPVTNDTLVSGFENSLFISNTNGNIVFAPLDGSELPLMAGTLLKLQVPFPVWKKENFYFLTVTAI